MFLVSYFLNLVEVIMSFLYYFEELELRMRLLALRLAINGSLYAFLHLGFLLIIIAQASN
jgi:hypothetical protein